MYDRRADLPVAEGDLDASLVRSVRRASWMRQGFYVVVLIVAMAGQVTGAVEALHIPLIAAVPAVAALELGGIVVLANADVRRRLGERAVASRLLSVAIAAWAVAFNWLAHSNHLLGGFYAGMSALGYAVWLMHTENQRRDRLRAKGDLPPTTPAYEIWSHWLRHPLLTMRAKSLAKEDPRLGLYPSIAAARADIRRERRTAAIAKVLHRKIRAAVDPTTADIAVQVYDLDQIAHRLADQADYAGLTALIAADLTPARLAINGAVDGTIDEALPEPEPEPLPAIEATAVLEVEEEAEPITRKVFHPEIRRDIESIFSTTREQPIIQPTVIQKQPEPEEPKARASVSLRKRVHAALDQHVPVGDERDSTELLDLVGSVLQLSDLERITATPYIHSWRKDALARA
jgi:hypothetical protein